MITALITYVIDPAKVDAFEVYAKAWIHLVNRMGGTHHGYFLPSEGANNKAWAMFSFPSFAAYEDYRHVMAEDTACQKAYRHASNSGCILSFERTFTRPVLEGATPEELGL